MTRIDLYLSLPLFFLPYFIGCVREPQKPQEAVKYDAYERLIQDRNEDAIISLLRESEDINVPDSRGFSLLFLAVDKSLDKLLSYLLENGANPTFQADCGLTPAHWAILKQRDDYLAKMIENGLCPHEKDIFGWDFATFAYHLGVACCTYKLEKYGAKISAEDKESMDFLASCRKGNLKKFNEYIESGFDINMKGPLGRTPLLIAAESENMRLIEHMVTCGADITCRDMFGSSCIDVAHSKKSKKLVRFFTDLGLIKNPD